MLTRDEQMATILGRYLTDSKSFEDAINRIAADLRETMRNIAIGSSALAAASLVLLSSEIPTNHTFIFIGILTLMIESILSFAWLLHVQTKASDSVMTQQYATLKPASKILTSYHDFQSGKMNAETFDPLLKEYIDGSNKRASEYHKGMQEKPRSRDYWDKIFIGVLMFGIWFLFLGILAPHICNVWSIMCP